MFSRLGQSSLIHRYANWRKIARLQIFSALGSCPVGLLWPYNIVFTGEAGLHGVLLHRGRVQIQQQSALWQSTAVCQDHQSGSRWSPTSKAGRSRGILCPTQTQPLQYSQKDQGVVLHLRVRVRFRGPRPVVRPKVWAPTPIISFLLCKGTRIQYFGCKDILALFVQNWVLGDPKKPSRYELVTLKARLSEHWWPQYY